MGYRADYLKGWQKAVSQMGTKDRGHSVLPITQDARNFYKGLKKEGVGLRYTCAISRCCRCKIIN